MAEIDSLKKKKTKTSSTTQLNITLQNKTGGLRDPKSLAMWCVSVLPKGTGQ